jgi:hypothetical protein
LGEFVLRLLGFIWRKFGVDSRANQGWLEVDSRVIFLDRLGGVYSRYVKCPFTPSRFKP